MRYKPLPPGVAQKLIAGYKDELTPLVQARDLKTAESPCPRCGGRLQLRLHPKFLFAADDPLPRNIAYCVDCQYAADPKTQLVLDVGSWANVKERPPEGGAPA